MAKTQISAISQQSDGENGASDFAANIQRNLRALFEAAHDHAVLTAPPAATSGRPGDIHLVDDGSTGKLYVKFPVLGWLSVTLS